MTTRLSVESLARGVQQRDRAMLGRALTLVESTLPADQDAAAELLSVLAPHAGKAIRVGLTGVPGAGKSTLVDALGTQLTAEANHVAVLAVDPSSVVSGGSILGDKTRMRRLGQDERAFIRPSPSSGTLGGVARKTRHSILVCEAAGFDVVLVETMGVGQSEVMVAGMVDVFVVLLVAGAGDELQGMKRGLLELADVVAINKADGDGKVRAEKARAELARALDIMRGHDAPPVLGVSALTEVGLDRLWHETFTLWQRRRAAGQLDARRGDQDVAWMWTLLQDRLMASLRAHPDVATQLPALESQIRSGAILPTDAATRLLGAFRSEPGNGSQALGSGCDPSQGEPA